MTEKEIAQRLERHAAWWRREAGGERLELSGADLAGADMTGALLSGAKLRDVDLTRATLGGRPPSARRALARARPGRPGRRGR